MTKRKLISLAVFFISLFLLIEFFLIIKKLYIISIIFPVLVFSYVYIGGRKSPEKYFKKVILNMLDHNNGKVSITKVKEYFISQSGNIPEEETEELANSILTILEEQGVVRIDGTTITKQ